MTYDEALAYWFTRVNFETRAPTADDLKLEAHARPARGVGDPQRRLRIVTWRAARGRGPSPPCSPPC